MSVRALLPHAIHLSGQSDGCSDELNLSLLQHNKHHIPPHLLAMHWQVVTRAVQDEKASCCVQQEISANIAAQGLFLAVHLSTGDHRSLHKYPLYSAVVEPASKSIVLLLASSIAIANGSLQCTCHIAKCNAMWHIYYVYNCTRSSVLHYSQRYIEEGKAKKSPSPLQYTCHIAPPTQNEQRAALLLTFRFSADKLKIHLHLGFFGVIFGKDI